MAIHAPVILNDAQREQLMQYLQMSTQVRLELDKAMSTNMMSDAKYAAFCSTEWAQECTGLPPQKQQAELVAASSCSREQQWARLRTFFCGWFIQIVIVGIFAAIFRIAQLLGHPL